MTEPNGSTKNHDFAPQRRAGIAAITEDKARHELAQATTPSAQLKEYDRLKAIEDRLGGLQPGRSYCLLSRKWFVQWMQWVGHPSARVHGRISFASGRLGRALSACSSPQHLCSEPPDLRRLSSVPDVMLEPLVRERSWTKDQPGPIDNDLLLEDANGDKLKTAVFENLDFDIISVEMWDLLHQWYGGGPKIEKRAVRMLNGEVQIELHFLRLRACKLSDREAVVSCEISRTATLESLKIRLCHELGLDLGKARICNLNEDENGDVTLEECRVISDQLILLDDQEASGTLTLAADESSPSQETKKSESKENILSTQSAGLENLGNTCFMNSSLQCLANVPPLRDLFVNDCFRSSLRMFGQATEKTNGRLAEAYDKLMKSQWKQEDAVKPWDFKELVGSLAERFTGNRQHDSMEFLEFLIDGLKEDCNRVKGKKLYVERADANGRADAVVATEAGAKFLIRNDSDIDDLFVGFYRSSLTCPDETCGHQSVAFDPFLSIKLPVMSAEKARVRSFEVTVMFLAVDGRPLERHRVTIQKFGSVNILIEAVASVVGLDHENCILAEIYPYGRIFKFFEDSDRLEDICSGDDLMLYALEDGPSFKKPPEERWGPGGDVRADDVVIVKTPFSSDSEGGEWLTTGVYGIVHVVDDDGDAKIRFDGIEKAQWVFNRNLKRLKVDLAVAPAKIKRCIEDDQLYTFSELYDTYELGMYVEAVRHYWDSENMEELDDLAASDTNDACGVIVHIRRGVDESQGEKPEYLCPPFVFHVDRETSVTKLVDRIKKELKKRNITKKKAWTFYKRKDDTETPLDEETEETEEDIRLGARQHIILEVSSKAEFDDPPEIEDCTGEEEQDEEVTLQTCFRWMSEVEQLSQDDCVMCQGCRDFKQHFKKIEFWSLPPVLVLQLKRFEFTGVERQRVNTKVQFPLEGLDLSEHCLSNASSFPEQACLRAGKRVRIVNMTSPIGQKLNGAVGTIQCIDSTIGRAMWCVQLDDGSDFSALIPSENLEIVASTPDLIQSWRVSHSLPISLCTNNLNALGCILNEDRDQAISSVYDLAAVSIHIGNAKFGHYVAYARSSQTGAWHYFDDEDVREASPKDVLDDQSGAYVLFYIRRDCRPLGWGKPES